AWPEMQDQANAERLWGALVQGLADEYGFTEAEARALGDHRAALVARDALAYRQAQKQKPQIEARLKERLPVLEPGARSPAGGRLSASRRRLKETGDVRAAAAVFQEMDL